MPLVPQPPKEPKPKRPRGHQRGIKLSPKHKEQQRASYIMNRVHDAAIGKVEMKPAEIKAAELYLSKTIPSLSAVEQTNLNEDMKTPEQMQATLKAMIANPSIRHMLKQLLEEEVPNLGSAD